MKRIVVTLVTMLLMVSSLALRAQTRTPDPFCSPKDFFSYLKQMNQQRVLYVVQKCTNIDLSETGPNGESFVETLSRSNWEDIFGLALNRTDVDFKKVTVSLIVNGKFTWLKTLLEKDFIKIDIKERDAIASTFPRSKDFLAYLIEKKLVDLNTDSMLIRAMKTRQFELVSYLRTVPEVDKSNLVKHACSFETDKHIALFKELFKEEKVDPNLVCSDGNPLIWKLMRSDIELAIFEAVSKDPHLNLSQPGLSIRLVETYFQTYNMNQAYLTLLLKHPSFNFSDQNKNKETLWHVFAMNTEKLKNLESLLVKLPTDTINQVSVTGKTALLNLIISHYPYDWFHAKVMAIPHLDINGIVLSGSPLLHAASANDLPMFKALLARKADTVNVGDMATLRTGLLYQLANNPEYFDVFFSHPDLDINAPIRRDSRYAWESFFSIVLQSPARLTLLPRLLKDPRFDKKAIDAHPASCSAFVTWSMEPKGDREVLQMLAENSSNETLSRDCTQGHALTRAYLLGDLNLIDYLFNTRKLSLRINSYTTIFSEAWKWKNWDIVNYFISKGYTEEINDQYFLEALVTNKKFDLLKKISTLPAFDPQLRGILGKLARDNDRETFDLLLNHPKVKVQTYLVDIIHGSNPKKTTYFVDAALDKFQIFTAEDKTAAAIAIVELGNSKWPLSYFQRIAKLANFDVNHVFVHYSNKTTTLYAELMREMFSSEEYLDHLLTFKTLNPNVVADLRPIDGALFGGGSEEGFAKRKKYFDIYFNHPKVRVVLPTFEGRSFIELAKSYRESSDSYNRPIALQILSLFLASPKFRFTPEQMKQIYEFKGLLSDYSSSLKYVFLNAFFSHPSAKPLSQWNDVLDLVKLFSYSEVAEESAFIIRYGNELDLNYKGSKLLESAIDREARELFDYLIGNPKVVITNNALSSLFRSEKDHFFLKIVEKRGKLLTAEQVQIMLVQILRLRDQDLALEKLKVLYPLLKTLDKLTERARDYGVGPLLYFLKARDLDPVYKTLATRIIAEDSTVILNAYGAVEYAVETHQFSHVDALIKKGFNINDYSVPEKLLSAAVKNKSLDAINYIMKLKPTCLWTCTGAAFNQALSLNWFEGTDLLLSFGAKPHLESILLVVEQKNTVALRYLLDRGYKVNGSGALVAAIMYQADEILEIFLNDPTIDPNDAGYDRMTTGNRRTYPIIEAARFGRIDYVRALLKFPNINKKITDALGYRAIDWAATNNYQDIVQLLKQ